MGSLQRMVCDDRPTTGNSFCTVHHSTFHFYRLQNVPSYFPFFFLCAFLLKRVLRPRMRACVRKSLATSRSDQHQKRCIRWPGVEHEPCSASVHSVSAFSGHCHDWLALMLAWHASSEGGGYAKLIHATHVSITFEPQVLGVTLHAKANQLLVCALGLEHALFGFLSLLLLSHLPCYPAM